MKLRQAVFAAAEMEPLRANLYDLFGLDDAYVDPNVAYFGLTNIVMSLGDTFLEVVVPEKEGTTAGRLLDRRGSPCGYMLIFQVDDFATTSTRLSDLDLRKVWEHEGAEASACHIHPKDVGGAIVSFDEMRPPGEWIWGGPAWRTHRAADVRRVLGATLSAADPAALAARWAEVLGRPAVEAEGRRRIALDEGTFVEFVAGKDPAGICGYTFEADDPALLVERAAKLGLGEGEAKVGDVALSFVPPA